jgi:hypothetical protein
MQTRHETKALCGFMLHASPSSWHLLCQLPIGLLLLVVLS